MSSVGRGRKVLPWLRYSFDDVVHRRSTRWAERTYPAILMAAQHRRLTASLAGALAQPCSLGEPAIDRARYVAPKTEAQTAQLLPHFNDEQAHDARLGIELARQLFDDAIPAIVTFELTSTGETRLQ